MQGFGNVGDRGLLVTDPRNSRSAVTNPLSYICFVAVHYISHSNSSPYSLLFIASHSAAIATGTGRRMGDIVFTLPPRSPRRLRCHSA